MDTHLEIPGKVRLATGSGGLPRFEITTPLAEAHIYLHGAHVTHFVPASQEPVLFMSALSYFQPGKPIRGGVPVIFPWFGPNQTDATAPAHGLVRTRSWTGESVTEESDGSIVIVLRLEADEASSLAWPAGGKDWVLRHRITVGTALTMELEIENRGTAAFQCEEALHTYFCISDIHQTEVLGLENAEYLDKADGMLRKRQEPAAISFTGETDRTYVNTVTHCTVVDPGLNRRILVEKSGTQSTVVWNPWTAKAQAMPDYGDDEWPRMVCVETGNVADNSLRIDPGQRHTSKTIVRVQPL